ncbi:MAG: FAD binding domain-containing protein [Jatrophihabitantaceae bacterium]
MIPANFDYVRADSVEQAVQLLADLGEDAKVLAGGHSLLPLMKLRFAFPSALVDITRIPDLRYVRVEGDEIAVGALTRHRELETSDIARAEVPLVAHVAAQVGDPQVRARGTLGGTLAHGDAASDLPTAVLALEATVVIQGPAGRRTVAATDFFQGMFTTAVAPDELITEVRLPRTGGTGWGYEKFTRRANDWPIIAVAAVDGRIALANCGETVLRAAATERALARGASIEDAAALADTEARPSADMHGGVEYRRHLIRTLTARALHTAAAS